MRSNHYLSTRCRSYQSTSPRRFTMEVTYRFCCTHDLISSRLQGESTYYNSLMMLMFYSRSWNFLHHVIMWCTCMLLEIKILRVIKGHQREETANEKHKPVETSNRSSWNAWNFVMLGIYESYTDITSLSFGNWVLALIWKKKGWGGGKGCSSSCLLITRYHFCKKVKVIKGYWI